MLEQKLTKQMLHFFLESILSSEIPGHLDEAYVFVGGQQDVLRLQVSVDDPVTVEVLGTHTHTELPGLRVCTWRHRGDGSGHLRGRRRASGRSRVWPQIP